MNLRQKILKLFYPVLMLGNRILARRAHQESNTELLRPVTSFYSLYMFTNNGRKIPFSEFKGKKVMLVNTASECGYTAQYAELQMLHEKKHEHLVILGFPANDFGEQEKGSDEEIANFCKLNYGISFPLAQKSSVIKGPSQNRIFEWLTHKNENGWNEQAPVWNFSKYLVDEKGFLLHYFEPGISPMSGEVLQALDK